MPTVKYRTFPSPPKGSPYHLAATPIFPSPPAPDNHQCSFCLYRFAYSAYFMYVKSHNMSSSDSLLSLTITFPGHNRVRAPVNILVISALLPNITSLCAQNTYPLINDGALCCFHFLAISNSAMNICVHVAVGACGFISLPLDVWLSSSPLREAFSDCAHSH